MINSAKGNVIVVGSGLAGMSAAVNLVHANYKVLVIERSKHLGGRTSSWFQDDMVVESGLHRYLSLYYHLPRLLKTAGVSLRDIIKWQDKIAIRTAEKQPIELSISIIHKPIRTIISIFSHYDLINIKERIKLLKMFRHMVYLYYKKPYYLDSLTVKDMADAFNIEQDTVDFVLKPFTEGIFFLPIERYSAYVLMGLILPYKWRLPFVRIGTFNGPMSEVLIKPLEDYITKRGGSVIKSTAVESLVTNNNKVVGISTNTGKEYFAD
ncbi:MAG: FAD-dependent oxidoreductase, partial [Patescibacteria group bacterium]|nr:FAD-dependent oxidoreductase [Patescibacteria group bacterium]